VRCFCKLSSCGPAVYRWTFEESGNVVLICARCCAHWRAHPEDGRPGRIEQITGMVFAPVASEPLMSRDDAPGNEAPADYDG